MRYAYNVAARGRVCLVFGLFQAVGSGLPKGRRAAHQCSTVPAASCGAVRARVCGVAVGAMDIVASDCAVGVVVPQSPCLWWGGMQLEGGMAAFVLPTSGGLIVAINLSRGVGVPRAPWRLKGAAVVFSITFQAHDPMGQGGARGGGVASRVPTSHHHHTFVIIIIIRHQKGFRQVDGGLSLQPGRVAWVVPPCGGGGFRSSRS